MSKTALNKLKDYWMNHQGKDYLDALRDLRHDVPKTHPSSRSLDKEIEQCIEVYTQFKDWTNSSYAKSKLNKKNA